MSNVHVTNLCPGLLEELVPGCDEGNGETTSKEQNEIDRQLVPEKRIMNGTLGHPWFMYCMFGNTHFVTLFDIPDIAFPHHFIDLQKFRSIV